MISRPSSLLPVLLFASLSLPNCARATDAAAEVDRWRFTTFGTLGVAHTQGDDLVARRDLSQPESFNSDWSWKLDSLVGAQLNANLTDTLSLAVQGVLKSRPQQSLNRSLERVFLGWQATPELSFHAGRLGLDFYMLSDYRDVGFAYLWMRPPTEFYGALYTSGVDGADAVYKHRLGTGTLVTRLFAGSNKRDVQRQDGVITTVNLKPLWGGSIAFENEQWRLKLGGIRLRYSNAFEELDYFAEQLKNPALGAIWPEAASYGEELPIKGKAFGFYSIGAAYDDNRWQISGELGYVASDWGPVSDSTSAYLSVGRHIGQVTPYVVVATVRPTHGGKEIAPPQQTSLPAVDAQLQLMKDGLESALNSQHTQQDSVSVGARWDVHSNIALKFQWDHTHIDAGGSALWWNPAGVQKTPAATVDLVSASVNWMY